MSKDQGGAVLNSSYSLVNLKFEAGRLVNTSMAKNTCTTYQSATTTFQQFCLDSRLQQPFPASTDTIILFIASLSLNGYSSATIFTYISALSFEHKIKGFQGPTNNFVIKQNKKTNKNAGGG